jgi:2-polyprenyl-3-methyl-5-hydroxy-6-metoxy-1,4-benzoquinol methylase
MPKRKYRQLVWTPEKVARFWDWQSQYPDQYFTYQFGDGIVSFLEPYLRGKESVLDYGCGTGYLVPHLAKLVHRVVGADASAQVVAEATRLQRGVTGFGGAFLVQDLVNTGQTFDAVVCIEVVEHLYDAQLDELTRNVRALSKEGAHVIFTTPNNEDLEKSSVYCPASDLVFHRFQHVRSWNQETLPKYLEGHGFEIERVFATDMAKYAGRGIRRLVRNFLNTLLGTPRTPHLVCIVRAP